MRKYTCASCGAEITNKCKKICVPLQSRGRNSGKDIKCCGNPDFRECPNKNCECKTEYDITARTCINCGYWWGMETW